MHFARISGGAGHAHAGVLLILSLVSLLYVDQVNLSDRAKEMARSAIPIAAILMPLGFFLSVLTPDATSPNTFIYLTYLGGVSLVVGVLLMDFMKQIKGGIKIWLKQKVNTPM
jgi:cell division protein FtsW (lipid II flippase)